MRVANFCQSLIGDILLSKYLTKARNPHKIVKKSFLSAKITPSNLGHRFEQFDVEIFEHDLKLAGGHEMGTFQ